MVALDVSISRAVNAVFTVGTSAPVRLLQFLRPVIDAAHHVDEVCVSRDVVVEKFIVYFAVSDDEIGRSEPGVGMGQEGEFHLQVQRAAAPFVSLVADQVHIVMDILDFLVRQCNIQADFVLIGRILRVVDLFRRNFALRRGRVILFPCT